MRRVPTIILAAGMLAAVVAANAFLFDGRLTGWAADRTGPLLQPATSRLGRSIGFVRALVARADLVAENARLREESQRLLSQAAGMDALRRELEFARAAADLPVVRELQTIDAEIFSYARAGGVREAVIDRGTRDWVAPGDLVAAASGALIGVIGDAYDAHSTVVLLGDPSLEITGRVMGTDINGLVRRSGDDLVLDLVSRDEAVAEGQVVVTSGNDGFPAALIIGTIRSVDTSQTTLFTVVNLTPAASLPPVGRVLVMRP